MALLVVCGGGTFGRFKVFVTGLGKMGGEVMWGGGREEGGGLYLMLATGWREEM